MPTKKQIEEVHAAVNALAHKTKGTLEPQTVVAAARSPKSVLHSQFEWDNTKAAEAHRVAQARDLIRSVKIIVNTEHTTVTTFAYVRDPRKPPDKPGYVSTVILARDRDSAHEAAAAEFSRVGACLRRARELAIALEFKDEIDGLVAQVETLETRVMTTVEQRRHQ